jgi:two-component system sensor histidine kinase DegS
MNVLKHAGVRTADLRLEVDGDCLRIRVSDKGTGFDTERVEQPSGVDSFGLFSIRERLSLVEGRLLIHSKPGRGSSFTLEVPLASLRPVADAPAG